MLLFSEGVMKRSRFQKQNAFHIYLLLISYQKFLGNDASAARILRLVSFSYTPFILTQTSSQGRLLT